MELLQLGLSKPRNSLKSTETNAFSTRSRPNKVEDGLWGDPRTGILGSDEPRFVAGMTFASTLHAVSHDSFRPSDWDDLNHFPSKQ